MSVSERTVRSWEANVEMDRYIYLYIHVKTGGKILGYGEMDRKTTQGREAELCEWRREWFCEWQLTGGGGWHLERFSREDQSTVTSTSMNGDIPPPILHTCHGKTDTHTHKIRTQPLHRHTAWSCTVSWNVCVNQTEAHLGFVALLSPQTRAGGVELLGNDTQKLGLVLGSVAVWRADVHHLGRRRGGGKWTWRDAGRGERTDAAWVLGRFGDLQRDDNTAGEEDTVSLFRPEANVHRSAAAVSSQIWVFHFMN